MKFHITRPESRVRARDRDTEILLRAEDLPVTGSSYARIAPGIFFVSGIHRDVTHLPYNLPIGRSLLGLTIAAGEEEGTKSSTQLEPASSENGR